MPCPQPTESDNLFFASRKAGLVRNAAVMLYPLLYFPKSQALPQTLFSISYPLGIDCSGNIFAKNLHKAGPDNNNNKKKDEITSCNFCENATVSILHITRSSIGPREEQEFPYS